jgi:hypothetical protein
VPSSVAGQGTLPGRISRFYTAKHAAVDGALLWEKRYIGPAKGHNFVGGLALGPTGMVAITGGSDGNFGGGQESGRTIAVPRGAQRRPRSVTGIERPELLTGRRSWWRNRKYVLRSGPEGWQIVTVWDYDDCMG